MPKPTPAFSATRHGRSRLPSSGLPTQWLFCYGTLMVSEIFGLIAGVSRPEPAPASLPGFERRRLSGKVYPGIRRCDDATVDGVVYAVSKLALAPLDRYEGDMYQRERVTVSTANGTHEAWTYILRPRYCHLMQNSDWELQEFRQRHLPDYLARLRETPHAPR